MTDTERTTKPRALAVEEAIQLALESRWAEAIAVNRRLLEQHGPEEDTYNRLGKSLSEMGEIDEAIEAYTHTLSLNPLNLIAPKMVRKLQVLRAGPALVEGSNSAIDIDLFAEEPGKSGLTHLTVPRGTPPGAVSPGDVVELEAEGTRLLARSVRGIALGELESKLARRLLPLIQTGNRYEAAVARVDGDKVDVMVRETFQSPENSRRTSFAIARGTRRDDFRPYAKESLRGAREIDDDGLEPDEDEEAPAAGRVAVATDEDDLPGMQTVEGDLDEPAADYSDDADDDDSRPEDSY